MTTARTTRPRLPDPPEREPDEMTSTKHLAMTGSMHHLAERLGRPGTTLVTEELYVTQVPRTPARVVEDAGPTCSWPWTSPPTFASAATGTSSPRRACPRTSCSRWHLRVLSPQTWDRRETTTPFSGFPSTGV